MKINSVYNTRVEDTLPNFESNVFDLVVADPPFNKSKKYEGYNDYRDDYLEWCDLWIKESFRVLKSSGSFWIYCSSKLLGDLQVIAQRYGNWQNTIVWDYKYSAEDKRRFQKTWSAWLFFSKTSEFKFFYDFFNTMHSLHDNRKFYGKRIHDIWTDIPKLTGGYLAQKEVILRKGTQKRKCVYQLPVPLLKRVIGLSTDEGDLVLDLFSHSGTCSVAAKLMGRRFVAVEQSKIYYEVIQERLEKINERFL